MKSQIESENTGKPEGRTGTIVRIIASRLVLYVPLFLLGFVVVPRLIVAILSPVGKVYEVGPRELSAWHLRDIGLAMHDYANDNGTFPPAVVYDQNGKPLHSWRVLLLPYLKEQALYSQFKLDEPWDSPNNKPLLAHMPHVYLPPSQYEPKEPYATHFQVFTGGGAMFEGNPQARPLSIQQIVCGDGTSKTLMVAEAAESVPWAKPEDLPYLSDRPLPKLGCLFLKKGFVALMVDGSTHWFSIDTDEKTIRAMITWNGGEVFNLPD